ncbi:unnamed protein product, partial [Vitis vinifera]
MSKFKVIKISIFIIFSNGTCIWTTIVPKLFPSHSSSNLPILVVLNKCILTNSFELISPILFLDISSPCTFLLLWTFMVLGNKHGTGVREHWRASQKWSHHQ